MVFFNLYWVRKTHDFLRLFFIKFFSYKNDCLLVNMHKIPNK